MRRLRPYRYFGLLVLMMGFTPALAFALGYRFAARLYIDHAPDDRDYLVSLLENTKFGCLTLRERRARLVVVGDSHSYAAWDFVGFQQASRRRVGVCAMGGLYARSLPDVLRLVGSGQRPEVLVLGTSPRMFWAGRNHAEQVALHRALVNEGRGSTANFWRRVFFGRLRGRGWFPAKAREYLARVARQTPQVEALAEALVRERLSDPAAAQVGDAWRRRLAEARALPEVSEALSDVCTWIRNNKVVLHVVHVPESPFLQAMYSATQWADYVRALEPLRTCASTMTLEVAEVYELGNRHWVNRSMRDDYAYERWADRTRPVDQSLFDADHMNAVGAARFTAAVVTRLKLSE